MCTVLPALKIDLGNVVWYHCVYCEKPSLPFIIICVCVFCIWLVCFFNFLCIWIDIFCPDFVQNYIDTTYCSVITISHVHIITFYFILSLHCTIYYSLFPNTYIPCVLFQSHCTIKCCNYDCSIVLFFKNIIMIQLTIAWPQRIKKLGLLPCHQFLSVHTYYFTLRLQRGGMPIGLQARKPVHRRKDNVLQSLHPIDSINTDCDRFPFLCMKQSWHEAHMTEVPCCLGLLPKYELSWRMLIPGKHPLQDQALPSG